MARFILHAPLNSTGCGIFGQSLAYELCQLEKERDLCFELVPHHRVVHSIHPKVTEVLSRKLLRQKSLKDPEVTIHLGLLNNLEEAPQAQKLVAYILFETSRFPENLIEKVSAANAVWTPSLWGETTARDIFSRFHDLSYATVPGGVEVWERPPMLSRTGRRLCLANVGKWEDRKGHPELVDAITRLDREVTLHAFWHNPWNPTGLEAFLSLREWVPEAQISSMGEQIWSKAQAQIVVHKPTVFQTVMWITLANCDAAVFPHRGEGWGLPILESIALGVPTIAPEHTGSQEYMACYQTKVFAAGGPKLSLLRSSPAPAHDGIFFHRNHFGEWLDPNLEELSGTLQQLPLSTWDRQTCRQAGSEVAHLYSWKKSALAFLQALESV